MWYLWILWLLTQAPNRAENAPNMKKCSTDVNAKFTKDQNKSFLILLHVSHFLKSFVRTQDIEEWTRRASANLQEIKYQKSLSATWDNIASSTFTFSQVSTTAYRRHHWIICKLWIFLFREKSWAKICDWLKRSKHVLEKIKKKKCTYFKHLKRLCKHGVILD